MAAKNTSADALRQGGMNIATIGWRLHNQGVLRPASRAAARKPAATAQ